MHLPFSLKDCGSTLHLAMEPTVDECASFVSIETILALAGFPARAGDAEDEATSGGHFWRCSAWILPSTHA